MANALVPIATTTLTSATNTVTFSSISQDYKDLVLITYVVSSADYASVSLRFNGDSGNNYATVFMRGDSGGAASFGNSNSPYGYTYWSGYSANWSGISTINIFDYSSTNKYKSSLVKVTETNATPTPNGVAVNYGIWRNTSAITSVQIAALDYTQNYKIGSTFSLYGVR